MENIINVNENLNNVEDSVNEISYDCKSPINVKDNINTDTTSNTAYSYRSKNLEIGDAFIDTQLYDADAAYNRLKLLRKIMKEWKTLFNDLDRRDIPSNIVEGYERIWANMRTIELEESEIIKLGE